MKKIYFYDNINPLIHDDIFEYRGFVPFSKFNVNKNYIKTNIFEDADYFYMGQFTCSGNDFNKNNFKYFNIFPNKHICDIEGDWGYKYAPKDILENCIFTTNGVKKEYIPYSNNIFIRPTFSKVLAGIVKDYKKREYKPAKEKQFGFKGFPDPFGVRYRIANILKNSSLKNDIEFNNKWHGGTQFNDTIVSEYIKRMYNNSFSLCPRGTGVDSVRFFESCYFGRIPIVIGDNLLFGEKYFQKPFFFKIEPSLTDSEILDKLKYISSLKQETIDEMSMNCIEFFDSYVINYFKDPDKCFFDWLKEKE